MTDLLARFRARRSPHREALKRAQASILLYIPEREDKGPLAVWSDRRNTR